MERNYNFPVPYHFSAFEVSFAPGRLQSMGIWDLLPRYMRTEIMEAYNRRAGYTLTREDLDNINDEAWEKISLLFS